MRLDMVEVLDRLGYGNLDEAFEQDKAARGDRKVVRLSFDLAYTPIDEDDFDYDPAEDPQNIFDGLCDEFENLYHGVELVHSEIIDVPDPAPVDEACKKRVRESLDDAHVSQVSFDVVWNPELHPEILDDFIEDVMKLNVENKLEIVGYDKESMDDQYVDQLGQMYDQDAFNEGCDEDVDEGILGTGLGAVAGGLLGGPVGAIAGGLAGHVLTDDLDIEQADSSNCDENLIGAGLGAIAGGLAAGPKGALTGAKIGHELTEAKELPIRKILIDNHIMDMLDKDPHGAINKAIEAVKESPEVSTAQKAKFAKEMSTDSLNKRISTLATYAYDVNKATLK